MRRYKVDGDEFKEVSLEVALRGCSKSIRKQANGEVIDEIKALYGDKDIGDVFKENFISHLCILEEGKWNLRRYMEAIRFIGYCMIGHSLLEAYRIVYPNESSRIINEGGEKTLQYRAEGYNRSVLVNKIRERILVPSYVLNAPLHQKALNKLAMLIERPDVKPMTLVKACEVILQYTKQPDLVKMEGKLEVRSNAIGELRDIAESMAMKLEGAMKNGKIGVKDAIEMDIMGIDEDEVEMKEIDGIYRKLEASSGKVNEGGI